MEGVKFETCQLDNLIDTSTILDFIERFNKFSQATYFVQSFPKLAQIIFGQSLTKAITLIFLNFQNSSPDTVFQI